MNEQSNKSGIWFSRMERTTRVLGAAGVVLVLISGPAARIGALPPLVTMLCFALGSLALLICVATGLISLGLSRNRGTTGFKAGFWVAVILGVTITVNNFSWLRSSSSAPPIHDITTDINNPPEFVDVLPLRADAPNPPEYLGGEVSEQQRQAFPDLTSQTFAQPVDEVFTAAMETVNDMGWEPAGEDASTGRLEATDTTFFFGFKDDIVVRIRAEADGTRVDVRSKSRLGMGDMGTNARRIQAFQSALAGRLAG